LLDIPFDVQTCFEEKLSKEQKTFMHILRCIEEYLPVLIRPYAGTGRIPYQYQPFLRSQFAKNFFQIETTTKLIERLRADPNLLLLSMKGETLVCPGHEETTTIKEEANLQF